MVKIMFVRVIYCFFIDDSLVNDNVILNIFDIRMVVVINFEDLDLVVNL